MFTIARGLAQLTALTDMKCSPSTLTHMFITVIRITNALIHEVYNLYCDSLLSRMYRAQIEFLPVLIFFHCFSFYNLVIFTS